MLTGRVVSLHDYRDRSVKSVLGRLVNRLGEPMIRQSVTQGMRILGRQFVMGRTVEEALERGADDEKRGYRHSFDMLGEAAHTEADAKRYFDAYNAAIAASTAGNGFRWTTAADLQELVGSEALSTADAEAMRTWSEAPCFRGLGESSARAKSQ